MRAATFRILGGTMKLYFAPGACSLSPHIALLEGGLTADYEQVDLKAKTLKSGGDFREVNPKGSVPVLKTDEGDVLTEGPAIVQYIADLAPGSELAPKAGSKERYKLMEWLNFISTELHKTFSPLFRPNTPDAYKEITKENLAAKFAYVDQRLAKTQYLMGDHFTVADGYLFVILRWAQSMKLDMSKFANLKTYFERVSARPKVQEALKAEGLT
jgi:glutathione S-transferase